MAAIKGIAGFRLTVMRFLALALLSASLQVATAALQPVEVGVVVMHGKGGQPGRFVSELAAALEKEGFQVANLDMPWSRRRGYDVDMRAATDEVFQALDVLRARGARRFFVAGHSQGAVFALQYAGMHKVDGIAAIAPGGQVDARVFIKMLGAHVAKARRMVEDGRGSDKAEFGDYEGSRGASTVNTTAAIYLDWFDPEGAHTSRVFRKVLKDTPVLYVSPTRDYLFLRAIRDRDFGMLHSTPHTRIVEPDSDHLNAPGAAAPHVITWIREVLGQP